MQAALDTIARPQHVKTVEIVLEHLRDITQTSKF
jgi:hypothetical protein